MQKNEAHLIVRDASGNFALKTALLLPILLGCIGVGIDITSMSETKATMQGIADSASLAAAAAMLKDGYQASQAEELASSLINGHAAVSIGNINSSTLHSDVAVTTTPRLDSGSDVNVSVKINYTVPLTPFMSFFGKTFQEITVVSNAASAPDVKNAVSMYLVLDKSGSMLTSTNMVNPAKTKCARYEMPNANTMVNKGNLDPCMYYQIEALQNSVSELLDIFEANDAQAKFIRVGAVSYDSSAQNPSSLAWSRSEVRSYVKKLVANGGTSSTAAFKQAYADLTDPAENQAHKLANGLTPQKYIVFMTDGANNKSSDDTTTLTHCNDAKSKGITVYSIAFNAPATAKTFLQKCASSDSTFFDAEDAAALSEAFQTIGHNTAGNPTRLTN